MSTNPYLEALEAMLATDAPNIQTIRCPNGTVLEYDAESWTAVKLPSLTPLTEEQWQETNIVVREVQP